MFLQQTQAQVYKFYSVDCNIWSRLQ